MLPKPLLATLLTMGALGMLCSTPQSTLAISISPDTHILLATAYTDQTLPTLRRGNRGKSVRKLQQILQDNGFLGAANARLSNPGYNIIDGVFGAVTENAIKDLQQRYKLPVTGVVNPGTWEVLDMQENPRRLPLPWKG